jgi:hypothetical protein
MQCWREYNPIVVSLPCFADHVLAYIIFTQCTLIVEALKFVQHEQQVVQRLDLLLSLFSVLQIFSSICDNVT